MIRVTEKAFQRTVTDALDLYGWLWVHFPQMVGNQVGVPDLLCWKGERYLLLELKVEMRQLSPGQQKWHENALVYGVPVYVIRNSDEDWERLISLVNASPSPPEAL